jgi:hypothetical protein
MSRSPARVTQADVCRTIKAAPVVYLFSIGKDRQGECHYRAELGQ